MLVVGGGPAGLTAALTLGRRGADVTLVEAAPELGGMAGSRTIGGLRVDLGSHRLHSVASPQVESLLVDLLGDDLQVRLRNGRLRIGGRWVRFPLRSTDLVRSLPPRFVLSAARDTLLGPVRRRTPIVERSTDDTFAAVVRRGLGPAMLDDFYGPYAEKLWGRPAEHLAGDLARRRIAASSPGRLLAKVARAARREPIVFRYPRLGYGQVVDELVRHCEDAGVEIRVETTAAEVDVGTPGSAVVALSDGSSLDVDRVLWSAPVGTLPAVVRGAAPPGPIVQLRHRSMVLSYLVFDGEPVSPFDAHYLPSTESIATRMSEPRNYRDGPDPNGRTVLCLEVPCDRDDDVWSSTAADLGERLASDLRSMGLTERSPVAFDVVRLPNVYPVIGPEDVGPLERLLAWSQSLPGITPFGRQGLFVADNLHHVMEMGLAAAAAVDDNGGWDEAAWSVSLADFAMNVVED